MNNDESTFYINGAEFFYNPATSIYCMDRLNETQKKIISYDLLIPYLQVIKEEAKKHWSAYFSVEIAVKDKGILSVGLGENESIISWYDSVSDTYLTSLGDAQTNGETLFASGFNTPPLWGVLKQLS